MIEINRREIFRYLGYGTHEPDQAACALAEACIEELSQAADCKCVYRQFSLEWEESALCMGPLKVQSGNLSKNLRGCTQVVLFAATLGPAVDRLLARWTRVQMSHAAVLQAAAAAWIEAYCDACQHKIIAEAGAQGLFVRPRFSPGYGDFALAHQRDLIRILDCPRRIGLTLTDGLTLAPGKSVTAVMGLSPLDEQCHIAGCEACNKRDCAFRRS